MENLNAEQVKKALECWASGKPCDEKCSILDHEEGGHCLKLTIRSVFALIKSQEQRIKELTEENEKLRAEVSVKKKLLDKCVDLEDGVRADTVRKMQSAIKKYYSQPRYQPTRKNPNKHTMIEHLFNVIDLTAKEILEDVCDTTN